MLAAFKDENSFMKSFTKQLGRTRRHSVRRVRRAGLSLVELLIALAIIAALLTATGVALDVSFKAYAIATQSASTQSATRLLTNRLLTNIRTASAHGPVDMTLSEIADGAVLVTDTLVESPFIEFADRNGDTVRLSYDSASQALEMIRTPVSTGIEQPAEPVMEGVTECIFKLKRGKDRDGIYVLERATFDFTVEAGDDSTMQIEAGNVPPVRVIASTRPRRF
ncbi:MAG: prepilin-type N-terminal cleavage/methylation domain-containing protein [Algisphaera sp.]